MYPLRLIRSFMHASLQQDLAYRANFWVTLLHALLNLLVAVAALLILFGQIEEINGWDFSATLALMGVYLLVSALRGLFIGPSLEALVGLGQEVWSGNFDFTLLRPVNTQFLVTFRIWRFFALFDLLLGIGVLSYAVVQSPTAVGIGQWLLFLASTLAGLLTLYALLLAFSALVFWSPGFLFTWVFDAIFQLARYPVGIYPPALRIFLTWVIPVGVITTIPAQALSGQVGGMPVFGSLTVSLVLFVLASWLFQVGIRRYHSASS